MDRRIAAISVALSAAILAGCAALKAEDMKVYRRAQLKQGEYEAVARLWVETWRTRFWVPSYSSPKDGNPSIANHRHMAANTIETIAVNLMGASRYGLPPMPWQFWLPCAHFSMASAMPA